MQVTRSSQVVELRLTTAEADRLELALKRATFEDTPPERQTEILDFAMALLQELSTKAV